MGARRGTIATVLTVIASIALFFAIVLAYVNWAALDARQFANRATAALKDDGVRDYVAQKITDELVLRSDSDLLAARPAIQAAASAVVASKPFGKLFHAAAADLHRALFQHDQNTVTLTVADVGVLLNSALTRLNIKGIPRPPSDEDVRVVRENVESTGWDIARIAEDLHVLAIVLLVVVVLLYAGAIALSRDRRVAIARLGIGVACAGAAVVVAYVVVHEIVLSRFADPDARAAVDGVWDAFLQDLRTAGFVLALCGAVVAAAATSVLRPTGIEVPLRRIWQVAVVQPLPTRWLVVRAVVFIAIGVLLLTSRDAVIALAVTAVGVLLIFKGVEMLLRLIALPPAELERARREHAEQRVRTRRVVVIAGVAALLVVGGAAAFVGSGGVSVAAPAFSGCNGSRELCDRTIDEVAFPSTHNAMSAPLPNWYSSQQNKPVDGQLADGVRGLLIDAHYGIPVSGRVKTDLEREPAAVEKAQEAELSDESIAAAKRIRDRLGFAGEGESGIYFCHMLCELGATPAQTMLGWIRDFVVANPDEVVVVVVEDYVDPQEFAKEIEKSGLAEYAYRGPWQAPFPTLGEMIDDGGRVVILAENDAGTNIPYYHRAYAGALQETPYTFHKVPELTDPPRIPASCVEKRGIAGSPLFLLNHWISTDPVPKPSDAKKVNAYEPLMRRARECDRIRDAFPNFVAVNFYREGDLFRVVDELNGVTAAR